MRTRAILLVLALLAVAGFAALNWSEFMRSSPLLFGPIVMDAPLGLVMLLLLALATIAFVLTSAAIRTNALIESRQHSKTLEAQRTLADKAEASRFTDLRTHLDTQLTELRQRDAISAAEFEKAMVQSQRELRTQLEQMSRTMATRLSEVEHRIDQRLSGAPLTASAPLRRDMAAPDADVTLPLAKPEGSYAQQAHDAQRRDDHARASADRAHDARVHQERHGEEVVEQRPAGTGWRRWF